MAGCMRRRTNLTTRISLGLLVLFNLIDAYLTHKYVDSIVIGEANPLMAHLLNQGAFLFFLIKGGVISFCGLVLCALDTKVSRIALYSLTVLYAALMGWWIYLLNSF